MGKTMTASAIRTPAPTILCFRALSISNSNRFVVNRVETWWNSISIKFLMRRKFAEITQKSVGLNKIFLLPSAEGLTGGEK